MPAFDAAWLSMSIAARGADARTPSAKSMSRNHHATRYGARAAITRHFFFLSYAIDYYAGFSLPAAGFNYRLFAIIFDAISSPPLSLLMPPPRRCRFRHLRHRRSQRRVRCAMAAAFTRCRRCRLRYVAFSWPCRLPPYRRRRRRYADICWQNDTASAT
jgi:hypothetical protein